MLMTIAAILIVLWLLGFVVFHIASSLIHLLILLAVVVFILHLFRSSHAAN
ncbi:MAG: lmo0937 family membrane protein [Novosphingobium sp.]